MPDVSILNRGFSDINPLICGWEDCEKSHSYGPARRDYFLFHYIFSGEGRFYRGGSHTKLKSGQMFLIRPGESTYYQADAENPWSYFWIGFQGKMSGELIELSPFASGASHAETPYLGRLFSEIKENVNLSHMTKSTELYLLSRIYEMFALMQARSGAQERNYVERACDFMLANYSSPVTIENIAAIIGIDRRYLCRIFTRQTGLSPKEFLTKTRLERAAFMLLKDDLSVGEIAKSVGYEDQFNFSKIFKKKYGEAPQHYRSKKPE